MFVQKGIWTLRYGVFVMALQTDIGNGTEHLSSVPRQCVYKVLLVLESIGELFFEAILPQPGQYCDDGERSDKTSIQNEMCNLSQGQEKGRCKLSN